MTTIRYANSFKDIYYLYLWSSYRSPVSWVMWAFFLSFTLLEIVKDPNPKAVSWPVAIFVNIQILIISFCLIIAIYAAILYVNILISVKGTKKNTAFLEHVMEYDDKKITETTTFNKSDFLWQGIHSVNESKDYIFLFIAKGNGYVIPKKALGRDQANKVYEEMRSYWQKASQK